MKKYIPFLILLCSSLVWGQTTTDNPHTSNAKMQYRSVSNVGITFSQLYTAVPQYNGTTTYCKDCQQSSVCQSGGTGAIAEALGGVWNCAALSAILPPNINASVNGQINIMSPQYAGGAKCDGSTDDTIAIQTAVYAACGGTPSTPTAGPHPEVYFPYSQTKCFHKYPIHVPCSNISITGPHQGSVAGLSQFYIGPAMLVQSYGARNLEYGAALVGTGQSLNLKGYTSDSKGLVSYNYLLNSAVQAMNGLGNFNIHFVFNVTSLTGSGGFTQPIFASSLTVQSSANGATNRAFYTQITNTSTFDAGLGMSTGAVAFDSFSPSINTNYEVELNRSGNNCQEFINGVQNGATKTCTGTLQMDPYEVTTVPSVGIARWPFAGSNNNPAWGFIDTIKIKNVSVHTSNYTPSTTTGVRPTADANTMLLDNFLTPTAQEQDTDPVYVASTTLNAFLPVYLRDGGVQTFGVHLSYLDVGTDLELSEEPLIEVDHIYNSQNAQYIGVDFHSGSFVSAVHDNSLSGGSLCINFGTGFSESGLVSNNRCSQAGTALHTCYNSDSSSYSETGAYCQDNTNSNFDLIFPFIDYASHIQHHEPFVDEEGPGSALKASFGLIVSPFGPESVSDGELSTGSFSVPFIQQQGGSPIMIENFDLIGGSSTPEVFNITANPTGQDLIINSKLPANTPFSNLPQYVNILPGIPGKANVQNYGAIADNSTDNTTAFRAAVTALGATGGTVFFPSAPLSYNFASTIVIPKSVTVECGGAADSTILKYTGSVAALAWSDATVSSYRRGGMNNCTLTGTSHTGIGIYAGGDPSNTITPSANDGEFLSFYNDKVQTFATGYQIGYNVWENRFYSVLFSDNTTGWNIPANTVSGNPNQPENMAMFGGAIQNGTTGFICNNQNADVLFSGVSFDGLISSVLVDGTSGGTQGCGVTFDTDHFEYFDGQLHPLASPLFSVYGGTPFTNVHINGGVLQLDDNSTPTIESFAKLTGGQNTVAFSLDHLRISSNTTGGITYTASCLLSSTDMCIEGTANEAQAAEIGSYNYWNAGAQGVIASTGGRAKSIWACTVPSTVATTDTPHCAWKIGNVGVTLAGANLPAFDTIAITYQGSCTGYPSFEIYDVTTAAAVGGATAAITNGTMTANIATWGTSPTDTYAIKPTVSANTCTAGSLFEIEVSTRQ